jgi:outer membrane receptor protein involved in Fe transport
LNSKFKFNLQGIYYGERWAKSVLPVTGRDAALQSDLAYVYKMKAFVDVNLRTTYTYNERLSAYLQFNNILAQRYAIYSGIPTQRFFAAMGASYSF